MSQMSNYLENALINGTLRGSTYTAPATVYVALYTSDPTDADAGTEVSGGSYARQSVTFGAPSNGVSTNTGAVTFPTASASWGTLTHIGIRDASTAGNLLYYAPLAESKTIGSGDIFTIAVGQISATLA